MLTLSKWNFDPVSSEKTTSDCFHIFNLSLIITYLICMDLRRIDEHEMVVELVDSDSSMIADGSKNNGEYKARSDLEDPPFAWRSRMFKEEFKMNLKMAFPVLITNVMQYLVNIETMSFCGRLPSYELESVGLAISIITALGWCVCSGMASACDTMFAQAFGSKDKKRTGLFLQRGLLLLNLVPIVLIAFYFNAEPILISFGQNPEISRATAEYLITFSPGLIFMVNYILFARYMQDQGCLWPPVVAGICGNVFNMIAQYVFVTYLGYGMTAAAICHSLSYGVMVLCELIYILRTKFYLATWPGYQLEAFYDWSHLFKLGIAGVAHITFEVIFWESNVFIGGIIGPTELATQSILLQLLNLLFVIYYGAGMASNIRVGQCLGANKPNQAKAAYRAGAVSIGLAMFVIVTLILSLQRFIPYIFTNKMEVINMVVDIFPSIYIILFTDPFSAVLNASLRGCGRQAIGGLIIFLGFYVVGLPCGLILAFVFKFGIKGLWIGTSLGEVIVVSGGLLILECQDWRKQAKLAEERIMHGNRRSRLIQTNIESQALIPPKMSDYEQLYKVERHIRTPSYPVTCSTEVVELPKPRIIVKRRIILKKTGVALCVVLIFVCGLILHISIPTNLYRSTNSTIGR